MASKRSIKNEIKLLEKEIKELEQKRLRSQAGIIEAAIEDLPPHEEDMHFFKMYTAEINVKRELVKKLNTQLHAR